MEARARRYPIPGISAHHQAGSQCCDTAVPAQLGHYHVSGFKETHGFTHFAQKLRTLVCIF